MHFLVTGKSANTIVDFYQGISRNEDKTSFWNLDYYHFEVLETIAKKWDTSNMWQSNKIRK
jgi:predicted PolB exonuclease-like 3'-5' exonuclease